MSWKGKRVLVTGGGGFIGSHLVKRLLDEGAQVHILLKTHSAPWRIKDRLDQVGIHTSDLTDLDSLSPIVSHINPQIVFHLAALVDTSRSWDLVAPMVKNNIVETITLLTSLRQCNLDVFIYTGSSEEYGDAPSPISECQRESPLSPYSFSKVAGTYCCQMAAKIFDLPLTVVRPFPTYGPFQKGAMFIPSAIRELLLRQEFKMSQGEQRREFNYVGDMVEAYLKVALCPGAAGGEVINLGNGIPYKVGEVVEIIKGLINGETTVRRGALSYRKGEGMECFCNNQKLVELTGWMPKVSLAEGLRITVEWYRAYYSNNRGRT